MAARDVMLKATGWLHRLDNDAKRKKICVHSCVQACLHIPPHDGMYALRPQNVFRVSLDGRSLVLPLKAVFLLPCFLENLDDFALGVLYR